MEQEFLAAQAVQETKAAAAKKAAAKANLARLKRKHELSRRKAESVKEQQRTLFRGKGIGC